MRRAVQRWWRDAGYVATSAVTAILAALAWNVLVPLALVLLVLVVTIPAAAALASAWRRLIDADRALLAARRGQPVYAWPAPSIRDLPTRWRQVMALVGTRRFWLDLLWLLYQSTVGLFLQLLALSLPAAAITWWALLAAGARTELRRLVGETDWSWAFELRAVVAAGVLLTLLGLIAVPLVARAHALIAGLLVADDPGTGPAGDRVSGADDGEARGEGVLPSVGDLLASHVAVVGILGALCSGIWLLGGAGQPVWPLWVWFAGLCTLTIHVVWLRALVVPRLTLVRDLAMALSLVVLVIWLLSGAGAFWPRWPIAAAWLLYGLLRLGPFGDAWSRSAALRSQVDALTASRREVVDSQAEELRRIERDLHDGAQARLVALSMQLGRAEARLAKADRPEAALVAEARAEATAAIKELRDLARGIAPPILQARGLEAAVQAVVERAGVHATVEGSIDPRPSATVESCAYFVCAEAITNVAKHAPGARAAIRLGRAGNVLTLVIEDDGPGGAVGTGSGLEGLRRRVVALDGSFAVHSAPGEGTTITVELPCAS